MELQLPDDFKEFLKLLNSLSICLSAALQLGTTAIIAKQHMIDDSLENLALVSAG